MQIARCVGVTTTCKGKSITIAQERKTIKIGCSSSPISSLTHLLESDDVGVPQRPVVYDLPRHILVNLQNRNKTAISGAPESLSQVGNRAQRGEKNASPAGTDRSSTNPAGGRACAP
jgi:hypothetical protein